MNIPEILLTAKLSPLALHFADFCAELDSNADELALITAAILAERNTQGDTCLDIATLNNNPPFVDSENKPLTNMPDFGNCQAALNCNFVGKPGDYQPLILDGSLLYLHRHWQEERIISEALKKRFKTVEFDEKYLQKKLNELFKPLSEQDDPFRQKLAAAMALTGQLTIITGGPGTGKTTTVTRILAMILEQNPDMRIRLAAPTGKAAARMNESFSNQCAKLKKQQLDTTRIEQILKASTIHRLLGWRHDGFEYNENNPLPCDCLLLDETSMVDQGLMAKLLCALPDSCRLILLGDRDQLASVEAGSVLGDLSGHGTTLTLSQERANALSSIVGKLPTDLIADDTPEIADHIAELTFSYRFSKGGGIGQLARAVNEGNTENAIALLHDNNAEAQQQLSWLEASGQQPGSKIIDWAIEHYEAIFNANTVHEALEIFESSRILTAMRIGPWGEQGIRERIEARLNSSGHTHIINNQPYKGLPLIILKNDLETGLFNGDTGIFWKDRNGDIKAWFPMDGKLVAFTQHQLPHWQPAWTLTVHRSQGSEYENILLVLPPEESSVVSRELIYTGITRAKSCCSISASTNQFAAAIKYRVKRISGLSKRLGW